MSLENTILESTITCPNCGHRESETMPTDACQFFMIANSVALSLNPKQGIVVCSAPKVQLIAHLFNNRKLVIVLNATKVPQFN